MSESLNQNPRVDGWKGIADYLGRDVSTVIRWTKVHGLPVNRAQPGQPRRGVFALRHELDAWMASHQDGIGTVVSPDEEVHEAAAPSANAGLRSDLIQPVERDPPDDGLPDRVPFPAEPEAKARFRSRTVGIFVTGATLMILIVVGWIWQRSGLLSTTPRLSDVTQLTFNGLRKRGLQTDGKRLYFGEDQGGWMALASMPVGGGPIKILWHPNFSVLPVSYSASARALLVVGYDDGDIEPERTLWVYPLSGGRPYRISKVRAHSAAWSPNGKEIAYAYGRAIYLVHRSGGDRRELASFAEVPDMLQWSRNGRQIHFVLQNPKTNQARMFELLSSNGMRTFSVRAIPWSDVDLGYTWSSTGQRGTYVLGNSGGATDYSIYFVHYRTHWWEPLIQMKAAHSPLAGIVSLTMPPSRATLFVLSSAMVQHGVMEYNPRTRQMRYILNNASVGYIDTSRDGKWFAWIGLADHGLTVARTDGSQKHKFLSVDKFRFLELPRWSPDGKEVAFMGKKPHHPWRDYILRVSDGTVWAASKSGTNQGAPTWSPNGKYLLYGGVLCLETQTCAIHRIDLANGKVQTLPDSQGLMTARWSPNGKYIVALQPTRHQLMLFNVATQRWHLLANRINGADLSWSANSRYVFADIMGANARIVRVAVSTGRETKVLDLNQIARFNLRTAHGAVFCPGPHGTLILPWPSPVTEIYSMRVKGM